MTSTPDEISSAPSSLRLAVVAPTYNNAATLRAVLDALEAHECDSVFAVDDGSTDATATALDAWQREAPARHIVIRHQSNRGKAAAMLTGFAAARAGGFTHSLTIDTDGQHDAADTDRLRAAWRSEPESMIVGSRPCGHGYPLRSRVGRSVSNLLVWLIGGVSVSDSQCGLRVYPLDAVEALGAKSGRYAFETEILIRAAWASVPIVEVPVQCIYDVPDGRVTHFRLLRDSLSAICMHARLLTRSLAPWPARRLRPVVDDVDAPGTLFDRGRRWLNPLRAWRQLRRDAHERERLGPSIGWGLFVGTQLPLGYKGALCLLLAKVFRLQPLVVLATSSLSTPPLGFVLWGAAIITGHLVLHGTWPTPERYDFTHLGPSALASLVRLVAIEWLVGGVIFGGGLGIIAWLITSTIVRGFEPRSAPREPSPAVGTRA